jgi:hypothetical protein
MRSLRVEFFHLDLPDKVDPVKLLERKRRSALDQRHLEISSGAWCRIQTDGGIFKITVLARPEINQLHFIDLMKVRDSDDIPLRVPPDDEAIPFDRDEDDGAGDNTGFCFIPSLKLVAAQRNYHGPTVATYARLVQHLARESGHIDCRIHYRPVLNMGLEEALSRLSILRNVEIVVAPDKASGAATSLAGVAQDSLSIVPDAKRVSINISADGTLTKRTVAWLKQAISLRRQEAPDQHSVENIIVTGTDKDGMPFRESLERFTVFRRFDFEQPWPQSNDWPRRFDSLKRAVVDFISNRT